MAIGGLVGGVGVTLLVLVLVIMVMRQRSRRRAAEEELVVPHDQALKSTSGGFCVCVLAVVK